MSSYAPESAQHAVSDLLYRAIFSVWGRIMACYTECREVDKNLAEYLVSGCDIFIVSSCILHLILRRFFSTLVGVLASVKLRGTTEYVLMVFTVLSLLTISSKISSSS